MPSRPKMYLSVGHLAQQTAWAMKNHRHLFHELIIVIRGTITVHIARRQITAHAGDILFYPREIWHQEWSDPTGPIETLFVAWRGAFVLQDLLLHDTHGRVRDLIQWLYEERLSNVEGITEIQEAYLQALLAEVHRLARSPEPEESIHKTRIYLRDHLAEPLSLDDLAERANLSKFHFLRKYRHLTGRTPIQDLQFMRMEFVRDLLMTTDLPLKSIASRAGLCNAYYLCRLFKRHFMTSPNAFRRKTSETDKLRPPKGRKKLHSGKT